MPHLHFIVNPAAGGQTCLRKFAAVEDILQKKAADYSVVYSEYAGHAAVLAQQALVARRECVVAVGGDGTVREIAQELLHTGVPMGILPLGTGNDVIRALAIPPEPEQALRLLLEGVSRAVDAIEVNGKIFLNVAGFGFDVDVLEKTRHYKKRFRGLIAYVLGVLHALFVLRPLRVKLSGSGVDLREDVLLVAVGNGTHIGGGMMVTPLADPTDGLMDVCVVRRVGRLKVLQCLARFISGRHLALDIIEYYKADRLVVECTPQTNIQLDGEIIERTPASFEMKAAALLVITGLTEAVG